MTKTLVIQSYRPYDIPCWIEKCMQSVKQWANMYDFDYHFYGDEFLHLTPEWYREKAQAHINLITDFARLEAINLQLENGYDRCIWVDADVIIFSPTRLAIDNSLTHGFCEEVWLIKDQQSLIIDKRINNSVCLFTRQSIGLLGALKRASLKIVGQSPQLRDHLEIGTRLLTWLNSRQRLSTISHIGLLGPIALNAILSDDREVLGVLLSGHRMSLFAVNLCHYFRNKMTANSIAIDDKGYEIIIDKLTQNNGNLLKI